MTYKLKIALLGFLTALASVVNNLFSPAMPALTSMFGCEATTVQLCLTASLIGLALGQVVVGPLSDHTGRRRPLLWSMALFVAVSAATLAVGDVRTLVALRLLQGFAAGGAIVLSRTIATDMGSGGRLMKMLAAINVVNGLMPIVAPMAGGWLTAATGPRGVLAAMLAVGALLAAGCALLPESLPADRRVATPGKTAGQLSRALANREFMHTVLHQSGALVVLFTNIAFTPFLLKSLGYGPEATGLALGCNGVFTALGAGVAPALGSARRAIGIAGTALMVLTAAQAVVLLTGAGLWPYDVVTCLLLVAVGVTLTGSSSHAMDLARHEAGAASAVLGAVGFVVAAAVPPLTTLGDAHIGTALVYLAGGAAALFFARRPRRSSEGKVDL